MLTLKLYSAIGAFLRSVEIDAREYAHCISQLRRESHVARVCVYRGTRRVSVLALQ